MTKRAQQDNFRERVRQIVRAIPAGEVLSYGEVARRAGNARAARAVGAIMRANFDENVPCHRVVRSDGTFGDYNRGGEAAKAARLAAERQMC